MDDTDFADRALDRLPETLPPAGLAGRILAAYDDRQNRAGLWARISEMVWPGAPVWVPASTFAGALLVGAALGVAMPMMGNDGVTRFSLDQPTSFSLVPPGMEEDL